MRRGRIAGAPARASQRNLEGVTPNSGEGQEHLGTRPERDQSKSALGNAAKDQRYLWVIEWDG